MRPAPVFFSAVLLAAPALAGDPARGYAIASNRQLGACTLCHPGPFAGERIPADIAPDLRGAGARLDADQLRQRLIASPPDSIMPSYRRTDGLVNAASNRPILSDAQIEDVVAWLATLTTP